MRGVITINHPLLRLAIRVVIIKESHSAAVHVVPTEKDTFQLVKDWSIRGCDCLHQCTRLQPNP